MRNGIPLSPRALDLLVERHGGEIRNGGRGLVRRIAPIGRAASGDLAPFFNARYLTEAREAITRGAVLLIDQHIELADALTLPGWFHPHAQWALENENDATGVIAARRFAAGALDRLSGQDVEESKQLLG